MSWNILWGLVGFTVGSFVGKEEAKKETFAELERLWIEFQLEELKSENEKLKNLLK